MTAPEAQAANPARRRALTGVAAAVVVAGIAYGAYYALVLNHYEHTDNAYVQGNVVHAPRRSRHGGCHPRRRPRFRKAGSGS